MADLLIDVIPFLSILFVLIALLVIKPLFNTADVSGWRLLIGGLFLILCAAAFRLGASDSLRAVTGQSEAIPPVLVAPVLVAVAVGIGLLGVVALAVGTVRLLGAASAERRQREQILEAAIEGISEGILYFDADDRLVLVNSKIAEIYPLAKDVFVPGVSYETCMRKGVEVGQWGPMNGEDTEAWIQARLDNHYNPQGVVEFDLPDGRVIRVEERRTRDGGIVGIRTDVTELHAAQREIKVQRDELERLNAQKDRFFAIIAHDLRSPFASLMSFSETIEKQAAVLSPEQISEYVALVNRTAQQAYKLLVDLLVWSRLQLDRMDFEPETLDLEKLIHLNLEQASPLAHAKGISISKETQRAIRVKADANMVNTILRNLMDNAIKFTPDNGSVTVRTDQADGYGIVEVLDTGIGIPPSKLDLLFSLGEKTSTKGTRGELGSGLGLQLCKEMVERQGGQLVAESIQGEGSVFRFTLPLVAA